MEAYDNEREESINQGADNTLYQEWLKKRNNPINVNAKKMEKIHKTSPDDSAMPNQEHDGLTKREKFAYGAMIAFNSNEEVRNAIMMDAHLYKVERGEAVAYASVREADLLIKALNNSSHEELK